MVAGEAAVFVANRAAYLLAPLAERYEAARRSVSDIFLPDVARTIPIWASALGGLFERPGPRSASGCHGAPDRIRTCTYPLGTQADSDRRSRQLGGLGPEQCVGRALPALAARSGGSAAHRRTISVAYRSISVGSACWTARHGSRGRRPLRPRTGERSPSPERRGHPDVHDDGEHKEQKEKGLPEEPTGNHHRELVPHRVGAEQADEVRQEARECRRGDR